jgi:RNA polymerase sigma factor (TIGR02999 family)
MSEITQLLNTYAADDKMAHQQLLETVYDELKKIARGKMAHERPNHTLQATALVHEAWLRLDPSNEQTWKNRAHFFGAAGEAMRRILVESARKRLAAKRGGRLERVELDDFDIPLGAQKTDDDILAIHEALDRFAVSFPDMAELVKLRYFVGMTLEEAGQALGVTGRTAKRWWAFSRAWLKAETKR